MVRLVLVCALLLGCACTEACQFKEDGSFWWMMSSELKLLKDQTPEECQNTCCEIKGCTTVAYALIDGHAQCHLLGSGGKKFEQDKNTSVTYTVFKRTDGPPYLEPMGLATGARTEDKKSTSTSTAGTCAQPMKVGHCRAAFPRFYFDDETGSCRRFIYGGCGGNDNNFKSQKECVESCPGADGAGSDGGEAPSEGKTLLLAAKRPNGDEKEEVPEPKEMSEDDFKEFCQSPLVVGPCRAAFQRFFFNQTSGKCERFIYGGCKGNKNNYEKEELCHSTCTGVKVQKSTKKHPQLSQDDKDECSLAADSGPCRAAFSMFYFDADSQSCKTFLYGGCRGNGNRYNSESECVERCINAGSTEGRGKARSRWTAAFFLFLTLAAVSFLLLSALIVITLRRNRFSARRALSIRSDKEELLPDSESSSVDSLPLPESPTQG